MVQINNSKKNRLKLAIANVRLDHDNFKKVVIDNPNRSYQRYKDLSKIINAAIDENADMLIMPEAYVPFEWLATVARTCARNNLAVVTGIEHIKQGNQVFNLTAVILPYEDLENKSALISFHLKKHYAPIEKQEINGYRLKEVTGKHYELYQWHDLVLCQDLVQVKMRNFSHFNPPEAQPQCVFFHTIVRIHLVTYSCNGYEFVSYCRKLPDIQKSTGMPAYSREF